MNNLFVVTQIDPTTGKTKPTIINAGQVHRIEMSAQHPNLTLIEFGYMQSEVFATESVSAIWNMLTNSHLPGAIDDAVRRSEPPLTLGNERGSLGIPLAHP